MSKIIKLHPYLEDELEVHIKASKAHILITIDDNGVSYKSSLEDKLSVFYIDLCKQMILEDWLCGNSTN